MVLEDHGMLSPKVITSPKVLGSLGTSLEHLVEVANGALTRCWADARVSRALRAAQAHAYSNRIALKIPL